MSNLKQNSFRTCITEEMLTDILVRLPVKSLLRFMCVSNSWSDLIGSDCFVKTQVKRNVTDPAHIYIISHHNSRVNNVSGLCNSIFSYETSEKCLDLRNPIGTQHVRVYGSSNGLICLSDLELDRFRIDLRSSLICIWNPSLRKFRTLPGMTNAPTLRRIRRHIGYHIDLSFGFHPLLNDYKVVRIVREYSRSNAFLVQVHVYTLSIDSWKMIDGIPSWLLSEWGYHDSVILNGVTYWLIEKDQMFRVVSFDTGSEEFEELMVPETLSTFGHCLNVEVYKESICLLKEHWQNPDIELWVLQESSFQKLATFVIPGTTYIRPLRFCIGNELLVLDGNDDGTVDLVMYNPESKQVKNRRIRLAGEINLRMAGTKFYINTYIESLVLLND